MISFLKVLKLIYGFFQGQLHKWYFSQVEYKEMEEAASNITEEEKKQKPEEKEKKDKHVPIMMEKEKDKDKEKKEHKEEKKSKATPEPEIEDESENDDPTGEYKITKFYCPFFFHYHMHIV